jgi:oxygen-independent coproporphyrinogen-3 oxidase
MRAYLDAMARWQTEGIGFTAPILSASEALMDTLMQGLRLVEGLSLNSLRQSYGDVLCDRALQILEKYIDRGWVKFIDLENDSQIFLTAPDGWLFSDVAIADLYENLIS